MDLKWRRISLLILMLAAMLSPTYAQEVLNWASPEAGQLFSQAQEALSKGDAKQTISLLEMVEELEPGIPAVRRDLARCYLLLGQAKRAGSTLEQLIDRGEADETGYELDSEAWKGQGNLKRARKSLVDGLKKYPKSGRLYYLLGVWSDGDRDTVAALDDWMKGIAVEPGYHLNYYEATRAYARSSTPVWALLYGEIFINLERVTSRAKEVRKLMLEVYKRIYKDPLLGPWPEGNQANFDAAVMVTLRELEPIVSDGVNVESLTMLRTRFIMDWGRTYGQRFPYSLFDYQQQLIEEGLYDAYNQYVFGKADREAEFEAWLEFHPKAMEELEDWVKVHPFKPLIGNGYNEREAKTTLELAK